MDELSASAVSLATLLPPLAAVVYLAVGRGARWRWLFLGIASWGIAVVLKIVANGSLWLLGLEGQPAPVQAAATGVVSAVAELGTTALFLFLGKPRWRDVLLFGAGIGGFEALLLLPGHVFGAPPAIGFLFVLDRGLALVGHTASRVLVFAARGRWPAALVAVATFSIIDGAADFMQADGIDFLIPAVYARFLAVSAAVGAVEVAAAVFYRRVSRGEAA